MSIPVSSPPRSPTCRHYSLHVVQHPIRVRMCGFGDKVRTRRFDRIPPLHQHPQGSSASGACCRRQDGRAQGRQLDSRCRVRSLTCILSRVPLIVNSEVDHSFFLVTVDLWSADGKREMNLVLHPSSSNDRYISTVASKSKKSRSSVPTVASPRTDHASPPTSHSTPNSAPEPPRPPLDSQVSISLSCPPDYCQTLH